MTRPSADSRLLRGAIGLGSNLGDRAGHLDRAVLEIDAIPGVRVESVSDWVETEPVGGAAGSPTFLNGAVLVETRLEARELLLRLLAIERAHGREREDGPRPRLAAPRTLDLDLLWLGELRVDEPDLVVPHPRLEERAFVLEPLAQIAPELALPSGRTVRERLEELAGVRR
ncbi:MAG: 2-amino-4-hydroxy-6-hydroxymethyldihydropteridine diphosphokinase [Planctomycetota bacterium]